LKQEEEERIAAAAAAAEALKLKQEEEERIAAAFRLKQEEDERIAAAAAAAAAAEALKLKQAEEERISTALLKQEEEERIAAKVEAAEAALRFKQEEDERIAKEEESARLQQEEEEHLVVDAAAEIALLKQEEEECIAAAAKAEGTRLKHEEEVARLKQEEEERIAREAEATRLEQEDEVRIAAAAAATAAEAVRLKQEEDELIAAAEAELAAEAAWLKEQEETNIAKEVIDMNTDYFSMKVTELRQLCSSYNIETKGLKKAGLIAVLNAQSSRNNEEIDGVEQDSSIEIIEESDDLNTSNDDTIDFSSLKVADLRQLCSERDLNFKGLKKAELIVALEEHDSTQTFDSGDDNIDTESTEEVFESTIPIEAVDFEKLKVSELRFLCEESGITWKGMKKLDLIFALEENHKLKTNATIDQFSEHADDNLDDGDNLMDAEFANEIDYSAMKVSELKEECARRGLDANGMKKAELILILSEGGKYESSTEEDETEDFSIMKVADLRKACNTRNISAVGIKAILIERLETHESSNQL
jgi:hypothetical protein